MTPEQPKKGSSWSVWWCPTCGFILGSATEHPDDPAKPLCETNGMGLPHVPTPCERITVAQVAKTEERDG